MVSRLQSLSDWSLYDLFSMIAQEHWTNRRHKGLLGSRDWLQ
jgi:hypothetical protein